MYKDENKEALMAIATHFEGCDISDNESDIYVLRTACRALDWGFATDENNQVKLIRGV